MSVRSFPVAVIMFLVAVSGAMAGPINVAPPPGAILDLDGQLLPHGAYQQYTVNFLAALANTTVGFAFRSDNGMMYIDSVSVQDLTIPGGNLLVNGDFSGGVYNTGGLDLPAGWTYSDPDGVGSTYVTEDAACFGGGGACLNSGTVQAYDGISQIIPTTIGHTYQVSFYVIESDESGLTNFSRLSTNGNTTDWNGNGVDVLVYAQEDSAFTATPEPASLLLLLGGAVLAGLRRAWKR